MLLVVALMPTAGSAFQLTASNLAGFVAYDSDFDVVNRYGLDPRLSYEMTGQNFNVAAGLSFAFEYDPTYPGIHDVVNHPNQDWYWTLETKNLVFPSHHFMLPDVKLSHTGSYADLLGGANWAMQQFENWDIHGCYYLDYEMTSETTGYATLSVGATVNPMYLPEFTPDHFILDGAPRGELALTAEPVPEPATMLLFGGGLAGVAAWRRRRNRRKQQEV
ncbi:PEP-CTERM sorting domain-containing protein [candidate division GN15 bacterium]|nr:PEP-CTERM sorting domain-containing protein [candidate division GN15 bacterium]